MKITQVLVESTQATVAFAFGRFNPAHQGHIAVWHTVEQAGANWFVGTNPTTIGPNDPLTFEQKSAWMEEIYPPISGHIVPQTSVLTLAAYIFKKLRNNESASIAYVTDETDWAWSGKLLNQYNGVEGAHGYYKFAEIIHVPSPRVSSATALRDAARADDKVAFYHASGTDPKLKVAGLSYFDTVKQACEKYPLPVKRAKKVKEEQIDEIDRRGFLKSMGAAAVAGTSGGAQARKFSSQEYDKISSMTMLYYFLKETPPSSKNTQILSRVNKSFNKFIQANPKDGRDLLNFYYNDSRNFFQQLRDGQAVDWANRAMEFTDPYRADTIIKSFDALSEFNESVEQSVAKDEQKTVAKTWDQMTPQEKISGVKGRTVWNEKTKKYYTVFDVPVKQTTDEASLATMRDYFAGDENARDPYEITKQRLHFAKDKNAKPTVDKRFRSPEEYEQWLQQNKLRQISGGKESEVRQRPNWSLINKK